MQGLLSGNCCCLFRIFLSSFALFTSLFRWVLKTTSYGPTNTVGFLPMLIGYLLVVGGIGAVLAGLVVGNSWLMARGRSSRKWVSPTQWQWQSLGPNLTGTLRRSHHRQC